MFRGIIISLINRIRRTNSNLNSYYLDCIILIKHLTNNGYPYNLISNIIFSFANKDRNSLIEYKTNNFDNKNSIYFISFYNNNFNFDHHYISKLWKSCSSKDNSLNNFNLKVLYKNLPNFNSYFCNFFKIPFKDSRFNKCNELNCKVCNYADINNYLLNTKTNIKISIFSNSTCNSKNIIYFIYCLKCNLIYIGESSRTAKIRINEHLSKIRSLRKCLDNSESLFNQRIANSQDSVHLYTHFVHNHDLTKDFRFQIYMSNFNNYRLRMETDLMYIFNTIYPSGLNKKTCNFMNEYFITYPQI